MYSPESVPPAPDPDVFVEEGDVISVGGIRLEVLFTPGHAPGHVEHYDITKLPEADDVGHRAADVAGADQGYFCACHRVGTFQTEDGTDRYRNNRRPAAGLPVDPEGNRC